MFRYIGGDEDDPEILHDPYEYFSKGRKSNLAFVMKINDRYSRLNFDTSGSSRFIFRICIQNSLISTLRKVNNDYNQTTSQFVNYSG